MVVGVRQGLRRSHHDTFAGVDAQRVEVLHVADSDAVVEAVANDFILDLFPSFERLLHQDLRRERQGLFAERCQLSVIVAEAAAESAQGVCCAHYHRVAERIGHAQGVVDVVHGLALDGLDFDFVELLHEQLAVFGVHDGLYGGAQYLQVVFRQYARFVQLHAAVQCGLAAECQQYAVGTFLFNYFFYKVGGYGQEVDFVGKAVGGLHCCDVGVDKHRGDAFLFHGFQRLRT